MTDPLAYALLRNNAQARQQAVDYQNSLEWRQRQMNQRVLFQPIYQARLYNLTHSEPPRPKTPAELAEEARKRMDERLGIPDCDLSWLDTTKPPLEDR